MCIRDRADGEIELDLSATSEANEANASVAVLDADNEPIVDGTTNDEVGLLFDVAEGDSFQVVVDSLNDIPTSFELTATLTGTEPVADVDPIDEVVDDLLDDLIGATDGIADEVSDEVAFDDLDDSTADIIDDLIDEENEICFSDHFRDRESLDSFFADFNPVTIFQFGRGFGMRG